MVLLRDSSGRDPAPCETDDKLMCTIAEDMEKPLVQTNLVVAALVVSFLSIAISARAAPGPSRMAHASLRPPCAAAC